MRPGAGLGMRVCVYVLGGGHHKIDSVLIFTLPHENWVPDELEHWMSCKDGRSAQREVGPDFYGFSTQNSKLTSLGLSIT